MSVPCVHIHHGNRISHTATPAHVPAAAGRVAAWVMPSGARHPVLRERVVKTGAHCTADFILTDLLYLCNLVGRVWSGT
jgi:hypothetical protein